MQQDLKSILAQDLRHRVGDVVVLAGQQVRAALHNSNLAAEAAEHLSELQPDVSSANNQQVLRHRVQFHNRSRIQCGNLFAALEGWLSGSCARVDKNLLGAQLPGFASSQDHFKLFRPGKTRVPPEQVQARRGFNAFLAPAAKTLDDIPFALAHHGHIDADRTGLYAIVSRAPGQVGDPRAGHHSFRGGAAFIDAGTAYVLLLDQRCFPASPGQGGRERPPGLSRADDNRVVRCTLNHLILPLLLDIII